MEETMPHGLTLQDREKLMISGVIEVESFDDQAALVRTSLGELLLQGRELKLRNLNPEGGLLTVTGEITGLSYEPVRERRGWGRLLR